MTPKARLLLAKPLADKLGVILHSNEFQTALDVALLQFTHNQGRSNDGGGAIAAHYELEGAKRFIQTLQTIADPAREPVPRNTGQLDHNA